MAAGGGCSKARRGGQAAWRGAAALMATLLILPLAACGKHSAPEAEGRPTPSGLPVPRFVSLKFGQVNARGGPGDDYKLLWIYRTPALPLQIVAETADWRRVCDPDGGLAWVHRRTVEARRTVMRTSAEPLPLRNSPRATAGVSTTLAGRALADLVTCKAGWCEVSAGRARGWAPEAELWGTKEGALCH